ncbi:hypothetical protein FJY71_02415, partial [candidate division WOR-3 bacterium]|nr:hypothetical protein [candidate division WOR-3 bacterium]
MNPPDWFLGRCRARIAGLLAGRGITVTPSDVRDVETGPDADLAVPTFRAAREQRRSAVELAESLACGLDLAGTPFE